jgi:hypothetical protein
MKFTAVKICALLVSAITSPVMAGLNVTYAQRIVRTDNAPNATQLDLNLTTSGPYSKTFDDSGGSGSTATSGHADQTSDIQPFVFSGSGHASVIGHPGSPDFLIASTEMTIDFTTDTYYSYASLGTIFAATDGGAGTAAMSLQNRDNGIYEFYFLRGAQPGSLDCSASGFIITGNYRFFLYAHTNGSLGNNADADANFENASITFTSIDTPEPASLSLLAFGAIPLVTRRRRR